MIFGTIHLRSGILKATYEKKDLLGLSAVRIKSFKGFPEMFHQHCEIIFVVQGELELSVEGEKHLAKKGDLCFVFPYCLHSYKDSPESEAYIILFDSAAAGSFERILYSSLPKDPIISSAHLEPILKRITELYKNNTAISIKTAKAYLQALVGEIIEELELTKQENRPRDTERQVLEYCAENFQREDLDIKKTAQALFISPSYLSKLFNRKLKISFRDYLNNLRISRAKILLTETDKRIVDVMLECGFSNQSSFNRIFYANCDMTPGQYKKRYSPEKAR